MAKLTKKAKALQGKVDSLKLYSIDTALSIVKECATAKFDESIDVAVQLGIDAKKSDQVVRGAVVMPNGTGKTSVLQAIALAAEGLGGVKRLVAWAKASPDNERVFWSTIYPRLVPHEVSGSADGAPISIAIVKPW